MIPCDRCDKKPTCPFMKYPERLRLLICPFPPGWETKLDATFNLLNSNKPIRQNPETGHYEDATIPPRKRKMIKPYTAHKRLSKMTIDDLKDLIN